MTMKQLEGKLSSVNGSPTLETRLRRLFAEQQRLREELDRTRAELDRVNGEVLQVQEDFCTDAEREEEYGRCLQKVLGVDPHLDSSLFPAEASGQTFGEIIEELERQGSESPSSEAR
jgi:hypothetical protein